MMGLVLALWPFMAAAADYGTREEAVDMVNRAVELYEAEGLEATVAAIMDPSTGDFHDRDLYVFLYDLEGTVVGHGAKPELVGRNLISLKDQNGTELIREMVDTAQGPGEGWIDYIWPNPQTNALEPKSAWVVKLGDGHFVGVGIYNP
jgi:cytochrome c